MKNARRGAAMSRPQGGERASHHPWSRPQRSRSSHRCAMSLDDVPINGHRQRTWDDLLRLHVRDDEDEDGVNRGAPRALTPTRDGDDNHDDDDDDRGAFLNGGHRRESTPTPTKSFLKKGSRAMRTSVTPKKSPSYSSTPAKVHSALKPLALANEGRYAFMDDDSSADDEGRRGRGTKGGDGVMKTTTPRRGAQERQNTSARDGDDVDVMGAWRTFKSQSERDVREFEALEARMARGEDVKANVSPSPGRATSARERDIDPADAFIVEREAIARAKVGLENERRALAQEKAAFEARRAELEDSFRAECEEERQRLQREKTALARDRERMLALPTKEERNEAKFLREQLERNETEFAAQQKRAKLTADRLRQQIADLTTEVGELRIEKRRLEERNHASSRTPTKSAPLMAPVTQTAGLSFERAFEPTRESQTVASPPKREEEQEKYSITRTRALPSVHAPVPSVSDKTTLASTLGLVQEIAHEDGRTERVFNDSRRVVKFPNGTIKEIVPSSSGVVVTVYFTNSDVKRTYPDESVEYYYAEVDTWHTTHPSTGAELYHFVSTGQVELHGLHEYKEILFPEGALRRIYPDGREEDVLNHH